MNLSAANSDNEDEIVRVNNGDGFNFSNLNNTKQRSGTSIGQGLMDNSQGGGFKSKL